MKEKKKEFCGEPNNMLFSQWLLWSDAEEKQHKEHKEEKEERKETEGDIMQEWSRIIHWQEKIFSPQWVFAIDL